MKYYIEDNSQPKGFIEITKAEYNAIFGDDVIRPYAQSVYRGDMAIDDVPDEHKEIVKTVVANKVSHWGLFRADEAIDSAGLNRQYAETDILVGGETI